MSKIIKDIMWDFNGTIIDDVKPALYSVNDMLTKRGLPEINIEQYYSYMDTPIIKFYENVLDVEKETFETIASEFASGYKKHIPVNCLMENVEKVLKYAKDNGIKQYLLSSSNETTVTTMINKYNLNNYFDVVSGANNHSADSKIERGKKLISDYKINIENLIIIGDTLHDYHFAREINSKCILTTRGHQGKEQFKESNVIIIDDMIEVLSYI